MREIEHGQKGGKCVVRLGSSCDMDVGWMRRCDIWMGGRGCESVLGRASCHLADHPPATRATVPFSSQGYPHAKRIPNTKIYPGGV